MTPTSLALSEQALKQLKEHGQNAGPDYLLGLSIDWKRWYQHEALDLEPHQDAGGMEYNLWLRLIGRDPVSGYRWAKAGLVKTENVLGFPFITRAEIQRFWTRVRAGEFARAVKTPRKEKFKASKT